MNRAYFGLAAVLGLAGFLAARPSLPTEPVLGVLRTTPEQTGSPETEITVTFDRPVAGGLEEMVDAASLITIQPAVRGRADWRDPVTLRFTPAEPLRPGATYRVTVANSFLAMDGSRLARPLTFSFRVHQAYVLTGYPVGPHSRPRFLEQNPRFRLLVSSPVNTADLAAASRVVLDSCGGGTIALRAVSQRTLGGDDPEWIRYFGQAADSSKDLRRVVALDPVRPIPAGCAATLQVPETLDAPDVSLNWGFSTYGPLRVLRAGCIENGECHFGPAIVVFSTPVKGADVLRFVHLSRERGFQVRDTAATSDRWLLEGRLIPRRDYTIRVDGALRDEFGQPVTNAGTFAFRTPPAPPSVVYPHGKLLVERDGFRTLAVQHVNVDTLDVGILPVPDTLEARLLARGWGGWNETWDSLAAQVTYRRIPVRNQPDVSSVTGVSLPVPDARRGRSGTLMLVEVTGPGMDTTETPPLALVQVTDLAVHARIGIDQGMVWVTGVKDGRPRSGVEVTLHDDLGRVRATARTDRQGIATISGLRQPAPERRPDCEGSDEDCAVQPGNGYVSATLQGDRAVVGISDYDPDLSPYQFGLYSAWSDDQRTPAAGALFTERGIYRPGEPVYAKAIVRQGTLGSLAASEGDTVRWRFTDREGKVLDETTATLSRFGTADRMVRLPADAPLGGYGVDLRLRRDGRWISLAYAGYQVAEYRPPEFLVDVTTPPQPRFAGEWVSATVGARYLFGAPMGNAPFRWSARAAPVSSWEIEIPGAEEYQFGESWNWWEDSYEEPEVLATGLDTLDARGYASLDVALKAREDGRASRVTVRAEVVDANRQTVAAGASVMVHPAEFYIGAKPEGRGYFWTAGTPVRIAVITVRPDGNSVPGVTVSGAVVRREWHTVRRLRGGVYDEVGEWVQDTVATCRVTTAAQSVPCGFTPGEGGSYEVTLTATDRAGRRATTTLTRWAVGGGWVPWNDESKFKMDVVPDRQRYSVGDTATVLIASPFVDAEAWVTIERERVMEQRRIRISSGTHTLRIPITEGLAPNAFVSVIVVRGRSAAPGTVDDPGRPTMRVGYAELRVTPEVKRLAVEVTPLRPEFRPGDTAAVRVRVRDAAGRPQVSEVTLWAVDEGVLSLTGYQTPDPLDLLYAPRGVAMRLASNLVAVAPQVPEGQKGARNPGGGGGQDLTGILRSRFRPTAFFLGSVVTDRDGEAVARAGLPDNITTFRVMAVAVTTGDRYGSGHSPLLATRPIIARPALPRFIREGDEFLAGVVVNHRFGQSIDAQVRTEVSGVTLGGAATRSITLAQGRGAEARFPFSARMGDSATFRFDVTGGGEADAVQVRIPIRPANRPVVHTISGVLRDTSTLEFILPAETDPARSGITLGFGTSPLAMIQGYRRWLDVYPYYCTEQISSAALPIIAMYRARREIAGEAEHAKDREKIEMVVRVLASRQRSDGGIGLWGSEGWTSPWLTAYAGRVMLEARGAGIAVSDTVLGRMADYLSTALRQPDAIAQVIGNRDYPARAILAERMMAADFLSRLGRPDVAGENQLLSNAARLAWEDRVLLAEVLARRRAMASARQLLTTAWQSAQLRGTRVALNDTLFRYDFYFMSRIRPIARLLTATLAIQPDHPHLGALVETLVQQGRSERYYWNTQDYGSAVLALVRFEETQRGAQERVVRLRGGGRVLLEARAQRGERRDSVPAITGLVTRLPDGRQLLRINAEASTGGAPVFYHVSVREVAGRPSLTPRDQGIALERWYESLETRRPVTSVAEGQVVRVRIRITVPEEREMVILDDPLPGGLEAVDLSLRTVSPFGGFPESTVTEEEVMETEANPVSSWFFGAWDAGMWSPFDYKEIRDDRVVYFARVLWKGTYSATYLARATSAGRFTAAPAHAEEMYNPGVHGRSGGGVFEIREAGAQ